MCIWLKRGWGLHVPQECYRTYIPNVSRSLQLFLCKSPTLQASCFGLLHRRPSSQTPQLFPHHSPARVGTEWDVLTSPREAW